MIIQQQDTPENWRRITPFDNIIGGQDWELTSRTTFKDVGRVSSLRSTDSWWNLPFFQQKEPPTTQPFANCSMDFIMDLPPVKGHDSILVVVDQGLTKGIILIPCSKTITTEETAQLLLENLYKCFGLPDKIISDWGPQFASKAFIELLKLLGGQIISIYRLSSPDKWNYRASQPWNWGILGNLLCFPSWRVVNGLTHPGVYA